MLLSVVFLSPPPIGRLDDRDCAYVFSFYASNKTQDIIMCGLLLKFVHLRLGQGGAYGTGVMRRRKRCRSRGHTDSYTFHPSGTWVQYNHQCTNGP